MDFTIGYLIFGVLFVGAIAGYWLVTRALRDPNKIYGQEQGAG